MDKMTVEFKDIHIEFFIEYVLGHLKKTSRVRRVTDEKKKNPAFVFTVTANRGQSNWLYITYQHICQGISNTLCYNLWLKTNPENFEAFTDVFKTLRENSSSVSFVRGEIAFDIPRHLDDVLLFPKRKRNHRYYYDTTYYGERKDQGNHGYCRFYDKKKQLKQVKKAEIEGNALGWKSHGFQSIKTVFYLVNFPPRPLTLTVYIKVLSLQTGRQ